MPEMTEQGNGRAPTVFACTIRTPTAPNFVCFDGPVGRRQDGISFDRKVDVADLSDEQVEGVIADWAIKFRQHVKERRANRA